MVIMNNRNLVPVIIGKSTDTKPTNVDDGTQFYEVDTKKSYTYYADDTTWYDGSPFSAAASAGT